MKKLRRSNLIKKARAILISGGIYVSLITSGYIFARFFDIPYFEVSKDIDITNVSTLIVTAWLAIVITTVFEKSKNDQRVEKDLVINRVGNIYDMAASMQVESNTGKLYLTVASSTLKRINTSLNSIYKIVDKCHFIIDEEIKDKIKVHLGDLREILTNTPSIPEDQLGSKDLPIEIKDSIVYYNRDRVSQIEVKFDGLKDLLLELQIEINKK